MARKNRRSSKGLKALVHIDSILENYNNEMNSSTEPLKVDMKTKTKQIKENLSPWSDLKMTSHALYRSKQRFNIDNSEALSYFKSVLKRAKRIGTVFAEDGSESILYASGRIGIYVSPDHKEIKTVIKHESITYEPLKSKIEMLHFKELRKLKRKENACLRRLNDTILEANVEISQLELRCHRSRSTSVKIACKARIEAIRIHISDLEDEIEKLKAESRAISRSMVSVV